MAVVDASCDGAASILLSEIETCGLFGSANFAKAAVFGGYVAWKPRSPDRNDAEVKNAGKMNAGKMGPGLRFFDFHINALILHHGVYGLR